MVDVFISYKREERGRCERVAKKLKALDLDVWFDARLPSGKSFDREIETTIKAAKAVLVLWSPASVESEWVRNEASIGKERGVLAAAQLRPCELPIAFRSTHYETLFDEAFSDDHPGWIKLLERIGALTGRPGLAGYSKALGEGAAPLLRWARANHTDPLALKMEKLAERLNAADEDAGSVTIRKGAGPGALAGTALAAALVFGALAWFAKPAPPVPAPPPPSVREVAAAMVGRWAQEGIGDCADNAMDLSLEPGGLAFGVTGQRIGRQLLGVEDGWLMLGDGSSLRLDGDRLERKARPGAEARAFASCR